MARAIASRFICDGRYHIQWIKALGRHRGRIIEIEDVDLQLRFHGPASKLEQMASKLGAVAPDDSLVLCRDSHVRSGVLQAEARGAVREAAAWAALASAWILAAVRAAPH